MSHQILLLLNVFAFIHFSILLIFNNHEFDLYHIALFYYENKISHCFTDNIHIDFL